jgi:aryl-alcohol dehydrogenase-like predicted oxidoreductase
VERRSFGRTGLVVSELGVGCSRIGGLLSPGSSRKAELAMLQEAADAGISFFDTADIYAQGQSEVLVGRALRRRRSEVVIATKGGYLLPAGRRLRARVKPFVRPIVEKLGARRRALGGSGGGAMAHDFSPDHLRAAVEASLRRLGTDYIDLYQLHSPSRAVVDGGDYLAVLEELRAQGKILHYGLAADDADDVSDFDRWPGIAAVQLPYNLLAQEAARVVFPKAVAHGTAVVARSCFAAGLLDEGVPEATLREITPDWPDILRLRASARELGRPILEVALQFSLATPAVSVTILGMRSSAHLARNLRYCSAPALTAEEMAILAQVADHDER